MATMIIMEQARWLNFSDLSDKQKRDILDESMDPNGLFGTAIATMQKRCEEKKKGGGDLQLCLPRMTQAIPTPCRALTQSGAQQASGIAFKLPRH
eukprot:superscaffoldBa00013221_g25947